MDNELDFDFEIDDLDYVEEDKETNLNHLSNQNGFEYERGSKETLPNDFRKEQRGVNLQNEENTQKGKEKKPLPNRLISAIAAVGVLIIVIVVFWVFNSTVRKEKSSEVVEKGFNLGIPKTQEVVTPQPNLVVPQPQTSPPVLSQPSSTQEVEKPKQEMGEPTLTQGELLSKLVEAETAIMQGELVSKELWVDPQTKQIQVKMLINIENKNYPYTTMLTWMYMDVRIGEKLDLNIYKTKEGYWSIHGIRESRGN